MFPEIFMDLKEKYFRWIFCNWKGFGMMTGVIWWLVQLDVLVTLNIEKETQFDAIDDINN